MRKLLLFLLVGCLCTCAPAQSLDSLQLLLRSNHPDLRALALEYEELLSVAPQLTQLPDLEVGAGVFVLPVETRTGPQRVRLGVTQMLPWPGKLAAMARLADARAQPLLARAAARQLELLYALDVAYHAALAQSLQRAILEESLELYETLENLALQRVETNSGSSVEVYRIRLRQNEIRRRIDALKTEEARRWVTMEQLTATDLPRRFPPEAAIEPDSRPRITRVDTLRFDGHPLLRVLASQEEIARQSLRVNELENKPDLGVGVDYIAVGRRDDASPEGNGRDVIAPRATIRLPLGKQRFRARRQEEELRIRRLGVERESLQNELYAQVLRATLSRRDALEQLAFLAEQTTTLEAALELARAEYANGRRPFEGVLDMQERFYTYRLEAVEAELTIALSDALIDRYSPAQ